MKYRIDSKDKCVDDPVEISLEDALKEIEDFPTEDEYKGGFIGFEIGDNIIQFVRFDDESKKILEKGIVVLKFFRHPVLFPDSVPMFYDLTVLNSI